VSIIMPALIDKSQHAAAMIQGLKTGDLCGAGWKKGDKFVAQRGMSQRRGRWLRR
jgi:hypothetical protein